jgi:hypothetical protein
MPLSYSLPEADVDVANATQTKTATLVTTVRAAFFPSRMPSIVLSSHRQDF